MFIGQAPGVREPEAQKMFAWTAGKRLFRWLSSVGWTETEARAHAYFTAVAKCYPGKDPGVRGDRRPPPEMVAHCAPFLQEALKALKPRVVVTIGGLAADRFLPGRRLSDIVGRKFAAREGDRRLVLVPLPHPSGASAWFIKRENHAKLRKALETLKVELNRAGLRGPSKRQRNARNH
jgi:uracil-DNA glycosylase